MLPRDGHAELELRDERRFTNVMYLAAALQLSVEADATELAPVMPPRTRSGAARQ